ncbi:nucleoside deaminase [Flavivirga eckloniae]|uniref:Nucleoside deaminase n=1 Tax=Flavivirga eckloniae TaxID=1803846 RepID=A0A2K9PR20_9FLAO|nr:nucleoside deaminase [Flavivirga eckloniae]AUP79520.1 nucleoside deaminase [Flavivirga eckloniae]
MEKKNISTASKDRKPYLSEPISGNGERFHVGHDQVDPLATQPWNGFVPECTLENHDDCKYFPAQTANIIVDGVYDKIRIKSNKWIEMACEEAKMSIEEEGGPFGAVIVQIDDDTNEVIRYWRNHNQVTSIGDPTAHAEVMTIRSACASLGVFNLAKIEKEQAKLPQQGKTSHCVIFSSAEPCPMCFSAVSWANIEHLYFSATRYDSAVQGVGFSDEAIYNELSKPYHQRKMKVYQCSAPNSLDAFNTWKVIPHIDY